MPFSLAFPSSHQITSKNLAHSSGQNTSVMQDPHNQADIDWLERIQLQAACLVCGRLLLQGTHYRTGTNCIQPISQMLTIAKDLAILKAPLLPVEVASVAWNAPFWRQSCWNYKFHVVFQRHQIAGFSALAMKDSQQRSLHQCHPLEKKEKKQQNATLWMWLL